MSVRCVARDDAVEVQFRLAADRPQAACVVGEFNDWTAGATPLQWDGEALVGAAAMRPGRYRFRYLLEGGRWENDPEADAYEPNGYGGDDSVVEVSGPGDGEHPGS